MSEKKKKKFTGLPEKCANVSLALPLNFVTRKTKNNVYLSFNWYLAKTLDINKRDVVWHIIIFVAMPQAS